MTCNRQMIYIYRGDDTDWNNEQFVTVNITSGSSSIDLSTMSAVFTLGNFTQTYSLEQGSFQVSLSSEITRQFPYGPLMGSIKILDSQNRIKTATTDIPFYITSEVITLQNQDLVIEVPGVSINVTVGGTVNYSDLLNKPSINGVTVEGSNAAEHYNLANKTDLDAHIADKNNPHEVTKSQVGLGNVDNTSDADKPVSTATANALSGKVSKSGDTMTGDLTMSSGTEIKFPHFTVKENQVGNPIIGDGNGNGLVINSNGQGAALFTNNGSSYTEIVSQKDVKSTYSSTDTKPVNGVAVSAAISTKQDSLTSAQLNAVNSGIDSTKVGQIETNRQGIADEITNRQTADNGLQTQIDALSAASDVTDIVGTYSELQAYDTSKLKNNDIIKVIEDSTHSNASSYYRWSTDTSTFTYIGSEGPYTTPAQLQTGLDTKQDVISDLSTIRSGAEAGATAVQPGDLATVATTGAYSDLIGAPTIPTVNNSTITITQGGVEKGSFTLNQSSNETIALDSGSSLPSQSGHSGEFLTTDGSNASWDSIKTYPTLTWFDNKTGTALATGLDLSTAKLVKVYKNGVLLRPGDPLQYDIRYTTNTGRSYIMLNNFIDFNSASTWKIEGVAKQTYNRYEWRLFSNGLYDCTTPLLGAERGDWLIALSSNGSSWDMYINKPGSLPDLTSEFSFDLGFSGSHYYADFNGTSFFGLTSSTKVYANSTRSKLSLLNTAWDNTGYSFPGYLVMNKFKVTLDDTVVFNGATATEYVDYTPSDCTKEVVQVGGGGNDYSINGGTINFETALQATDQIVVEVF